MTVESYKSIEDKQAETERLLFSSYCKFTCDLACALSFSAEDVVLIDIISRLELPVKFFAIDTGRLPPETFRCAEAVLDKYGILIDWYFPKNESVEKLVRDKGLYSFKKSLSNRKECCYIRKVEPLARALRGRKAWITGLRRDQSPSRLNLFKVMADELQPGLTKINPLIEWRTSEVWTYIKEHSVPYNILHDHGYPSIGCTPCTRAIKPGESIRAGRWWWEDPQHKECGLHVKVTS